MNTTNKSIMLSLLAALNGCASVPATPWAPMIDIKSDANVGNLSSDHVECQQMASAVPATDIMDAGSVSVAVYATELSYRQVLVNCLRGRGHSVLNW